MRSIEENIINFLKASKIIFCLNKKYASKYNLMFIFRRLIIIWGFPFFYIINVDEDAVKGVFKDIFSTHSYFIKGFKIEFIAWRSCWDKLKEFCFNSLMSNSSLNDIDISISLLNRSRSNLNRFWCFFNTFSICSLYFDFQCFEIFVLDIATSSGKFTI